MYGESLVRNDWLLNYRNPICHIFYLILTPFSTGYRVLANLGRNGYCCLQNFNRQETVKVV